MANSNRRNEPSAKSIFRLLRLVVRRSAPFVTIATASIVGFSVASGLIWCVTSPAAHGFLNWLGDLYSADAEMGVPGIQDSGRYVLGIVGATIGGTFILSMLDDIKELPRLIHAHWRSDPGRHLSKIAGNIFVISFGVFLAAGALVHGSFNQSGNADEPELGLQAGLVELSESISSLTKRPVRLSLEPNILQLALLAYPNDQPPTFMITFEEEANRKSVQARSGPGIDLHNSDVQLLQSLVPDLGACAGHSATSDSVRLRVVGYASSSAFRTVGIDSEEWNWRAANARALKVKTIIDSIAVSTSSPVKAMVHEWSTPRAMRSQRIFKDHIGQEYSEERGRLNRRVEITLDDMGDCAPFALLSAK